MLFLNKIKRLSGFAALLTICFIFVNQSVNAQTAEQLQMEQQMQQMDMQASNPDDMIDPSVPPGQSAPVEVAESVTEETPEEKEAKRKETAAKLLAEVKARIYTNNTPGFSSSLFLTPLEVLTLERALSGKDATLGGEGEEAPKRIIDVDGLLYNSSNNWIVWINGKRLTPGYLLPEIVGIHVKRDSVYLEWFDSVFNKIITINMRPHQVYDIQSGILLPG